MNDQADDQDLLDGCFRFCVHEVSSINNRQTDIPKDTCVAPLCVRYLFCGAASTKNSEVREFIKSFAIVRGLHYNERQL